MSKKNINWEPDVKKGMDEMRNMSEKRRNLGPQPKEFEELRGAGGVIINTGRLFGGFADICSDFKSNS